MDERTKQTIQTTTDALKQMMTLSTGVLTLEVTLLKDIIRNLNTAAYLALASSWLFLLLAVLCGVGGLLAVTGSLSRAPALTPETIYDTNVRIPAALQVAFFALGMILTVVFGAIWLWLKSAER
jgi:hypothetical protein